MKAEREDGSRTIRFTGIDSDRDGPTELDVDLTYRGDSCVANAVVLDHKITPVLVNLVNRQGEATEHAETLESLIDGQDDELGQMLQGVVDYLRSL